MCFTIIFISFQHYLASLYNTDPTSCNMQSVHLQFPDSCSRIHVSLENFKTGLLIELGSQSWTQVSN